MEFQNLLKISTISPQTFWKLILIPLSQLKPLQITGFVQMTKD